MLNDDIESIPINEKTIHLNALISFIRDYFKCDRENLFVIYSHIKDLSLFDIEKIFDMIIPEKLYDKEKDAICLIMMQMFKEKAYDPLEALVNAISKRVETVNLDKYFHAGIYYFISQVDSFFQIKLIKFFFKDIETKKNLNSIEIDEYKRIIWSLNHSLNDNRIDQLVVTHIFQIFSIDSLPESLKTGLLEIITKRIKHYVSNDDLHFYLCLIAEHLKSLSKIIHESSSFPDWLVKTIEKNQNSQDIMELCYVLFIDTEEIVKLSKLKIIVSSIDSDFSIKLLYKLCEHYCNSKIFLKVDNFIEFLSITDIVHKKYWNSKEFFSIISSLEEYGNNYSLFSINYVNSDMLSVNKQKYKENLSLKLMISLIFKGLSNSESNFIYLLEDLIQKNEYLNTQKIESKKISQEDLIIIEIFTNYCELYYTTKKSELLENFIKKTLIIPKIVNFIDCLTEQELKKFLDEKEFFKNSYGYLCLINEPKTTINCSTTSHPETVNRRSMSWENNALKDKTKATVENFIQEDSLALLTSYDWIFSVHCFLFNLHSMRETVLSSRFETCFKQVLFIKKMWEKSLKH